MLDISSISYGKYSFGNMHCVQWVGCCIEIDFFNSIQCPYGIYGSLYEILAKVSSTRGSIISTDLYCE